MEDNQETIKTGQDLFVIPVFKQNKPFEQYGEQMKICRFIPFITGTSFFKLIILIGG